jgi:hypothetical protein
MARDMNMIQNLSSKDGEHNSNNYVPEKIYKTLRKGVLKIVSFGYKMVLL